MNSIVEFVYHNSLKFPDKTALSDSTQSLTYQEFWLEISKIYSCIKSAKIRKKSRILVDTGSSVQKAASYLAIHLADCISVPIEQSVSVSRLLKIAQKLHPVKLLSDILAQDPVPSKKSSKKTEALPFPDADTVSDMIFSTGTSAEPECCIHTHKSMLSTAENLCHATDITEDTIMLIASPINLSYGIRRLFACLMVGATAVLMDTIFPINELSASILKYRINYLTLVPSSLSVLLADTQNHIGDCLRYLKTVQIGSSNILEPQKQEFLSRYPDILLYNVFGSTESGCTLSLLCNEQPDKVSCIGKPTLHSEILIIDEDGNTIEKPHTFGFLASKGPMNMTGYYKNTSQTKKVLKENLLISNDIGYFDEQGYYYFVSRTRDFISSGDHKISPQSIENVAITYPGIRECVCSAIPDEHLGQAPKLYIVETKKDSVSIPLFRQFLCEHLSAYMVPQQIEIINEIPKTINGKVFRRKLLY